MRYDRKVKIGIFWSKRLYNPFNQKLGLEAQFGSSDDKSDITEDMTTNTNTKGGGNYGKCKVANNDVESVDLPGDVVPHGFLSTSRE